LAASAAGVCSAVRPTHPLSQTTGSPTPSPL
jgi:hypothetical protein